MLRRCAFLLLLAAGCASSGPRWTPFNDPDNRFHSERVREIDVLHYTIRLKLSPESGKTEGSTTISFVPLKTTASLTLDAADMSIREVEAQGRALAFEQKSGRLIVRSPENEMVEGSVLDLSISYEGTPTRGLHFVRPDAAYPDKPVMVWSQGETEYNHHWFPCYDYPNDRAATDLHITAPAKFQVVSNGRLVGREETDGWATTHWSQEIEHSAYLTSLVVGELDSYSDRWRDVSVDYHVAKGKYSEADVRRCLGATPEMIEFFSSKIGTPYPYPKYAQTLVWDFIWGGMENISATTLHQWAVFPERAAADTSSEGLVAHELAHQWFGDLLTCRDWAHIWLNEGFATYFAWLWTEHKRGRDEMAVEMKGGLDWYWGEDGEYRRPTVCPVYTDAMNLFDGHTYPRGGWVLHMLRDLLGDEKWWKGIAHYVKKHARGVVDTRDFQVAMEEASGEKLEWFFDQWLHKIGYPEFEVTHRYEGGKLHLVVEQKQKPTDVRCDALRTGTPEVFRVPMSLRIDGDVHRVWIRRRREEFVFETRGPPKFVVFDDTGAILKKLTWKKSNEEWAEQLRSAPHAIARLAAAEQVTVPEPLLAAANDPCVGVRQAAVRALGKIGATDALLQIFPAAEVKVRRTILEVLGDFAPKEEVRAALRKAMEEETTPGNQSAAANSLADFEPLAAFFEKHRDDPYLAPGILQGIAKTKDPRALPILLESVKYGKHPWVRRKVLDALGKRTEPEVFDCLLGLVDDPWIWARDTAIEQLGERGDARALPKLEARLTAETDERVRKDAATAIRKIKEPKAPAK